MMEHVRQHDWCTSKPDTRFLDEVNMDTSVLERIIRNTFCDPMISSDEEEDNAKKVKLDWDKIFKRNNDCNNGRHKVGYVAGRRLPPPFPKLSTLTGLQQFQCLKILSAQNPNVLPSQFIPRPMSRDYKEFEALKEIYYKEQKEFIEWGKSLWASNHSQRALRPKPTTEKVYEAEFKMRASSLQSFPKNFAMAALISLENKFNRCEMTFKQDLVKVQVSKLPTVDPEEPLLSKFTILRECAVPEPCNKHPCWFTLPTETEMSVLPLTEIHRELAQYAAEHGARAVASEGALKCLAEMDADWMIPLTVCEIISLDGQKKNILVLGSEFSIHKKSAMTRTYRAFRHLLENALIPASEKTNSKNKENIEKPSTSRNRRQKQTSSSFFSDDDSSDEGGDGDWFGLIIDDSKNSDENEENEESDTNLKTTDKVKDKEVPKRTKTREQPKRNQNKANEASEKQTKNVKITENSTRITRQTTEKEKIKLNSFYTCSCADTVFYSPPPRSFRKWEVKNKNNNDKFNMIVHCSHKMKGPNDSEVITEPLVEYQLDLGGSAQSDDKMKSLALSLLLRRNASLLNVRIDNCSGDVVTIDTLCLDDFKKKQPNVIQEVSNIVYETVTQLQSLLPGHYILKHERAHGDNAFLYATRVKGDGDKLCLDFDCSVLAEADEAKTVKTPPVLTDVLLPVHKFLKVLPLTFTPHERFVAKEPKKPPARNKAPPNALRWPKRKNKKRNKKK